MNYAIAPCDLFESVSSHLFFIVGCGRSGTSLLQSMIGNHPDLAIPGETGFYPLIYEKRRKKFGELENSTLMNQALEPVLAFWRIAELGLDADVVKRSTACAASSWETLFLALLTAFAAKHGVNRVGEKSPHHVRYLHLLSQRFPKARFIHMVRDPRAVALSFANVASSFGRRYVADACRQWRVAIQAHLRHADALGADRYRVVRYEDLVVAPERVIRDVCAFLDLDFSQAMLDFHERDEAGFHQRQASHMANTRKPLFTSSLEKWRSELSPSQIGIVEHLLRREMATMGYAPSGIGARHAALAAMLNKSASLAERVFRRAAEPSGGAKDRVDAG